MTRTPCPNSATEAILCKYEVTPSSYALSTSDSWLELLNITTGTDFKPVSLAKTLRALEEIFEDHAAHARLRDVSGFTDDALNSLMERVREQLMRKKASSLFQRGVAQAVAIHPARNYARELSQF